MSKTGPLDELWSRASDASWRRAGGPASADGSGTGQQDGSAGAAASSRALEASAVRRAAAGPAFVPTSSLAASWSPLQPAVAVSDAAAVADELLRIAHDPRPSADAWLADFVAADAARAAPSGLGVGVVDEEQLRQHVRRAATGGLGGSVEYSSGADNIEDAAREFLDAAYPPPQWNWAALFAADPALLPSLREQCTTETARRRIEMLARHFTK